MLVVRGKNQRKIDSGVVAWTGGVKFTTQKHGDYGLEHSFCSDWRCSRCLYLLMQLAHNLWQIYNACVLPKVAEGCRKMGQAEWVEILRRYFHMVGIRADFATVPRRYIRRMDL